jgi:hypothetical protein
MEQCGSATVSVALFGVAPKSLADIGASGETPDAAGVTPAVPAKQGTFHLVRRKWLISRIWQSEIKSF